MAKYDYLVESIIDSIDYIVKERLKNAPFDKTRTGRITRSLGNNRYMVKIDNTEYEVTSISDETFSKNHIVKVLVPENQYNNMFILPSSSSGSSPITTSTVNSVNGQVGDVVIGINDIEGLSQQLSNKLNVNSDLKSNIISFTESTIRDGIVSGETLSSMLGKISKWYKDLKPVAFSGSYNDLSDKPDDYTLPVASSDTLGGVKSGTDITVDNDGNVSVNDNSHKHTTSNISDLDTYIDSKITTPNYSDIDGKPTLNGVTIEGDKTSNDYSIANSVHTHTANQITDLSKSSIGLGNVENKSSETIRSEITSSNVTTALGYTPMNSNLKGAKSGVAELDDNGKVPASQLPSYVDDVIEGYYSDGKFYVESGHTTEIIGETGKIYIDLSTNKTYRWSGSTYVVISETLALGETSSTAYRGDRGKIAYDHSQTTSGNPHNVTKSDVGLSNVEDKSSETIRSEITKENITNALGYTPLDGYTLPVATSSALGGIKSGTDISVDDNGNVSVNDNSHNHTVSNISDLSDEVLTKANTDEYIPTNDYNPATKKYVDDSIASSGGGGGSYTLPIASSDTLGGIKVGNNLSIDENGVLNAQAGGDSAIKIITEDVDFVDGTLPTYEDGLYMFTGTVTFNGSENSWFKKDSLIRIINKSSYYYLYVFDANNFYNSYLAVYRYYKKSDNKWYPTSNTSAYTSTALTTSTGLSKTNTTSYTPTADYHPATKKYVDDTADAKVDKVDGKGLSTNDYTTEEKQKLNSLENYTLPLSTKDTLGGVKIGDGINITSDGTISVSGGSGSTEIYIGTEQPSDDSVVMWVDTNDEQDTISLINQTGSYNETSSYSVNDMVMYNESWYLCHMPVTGVAPNNDLGFDDPYWYPIGGKTKGFTVLEASADNVIDFNTLTETGVYLIKNCNGNTVQNGYITGTTAYYDICLIVRESKDINTGDTTYIYQQLIHSTMKLFIARLLTISTNTWSSWDYKITANYVASGTFPSGVSCNTPTADKHLANKAYVDNAISSAINESITTALEAGY